MVKVKICGITSLEDAVAATEAGADLLGFICWPRSPRFVPQETVRSIVRGVRRYAQATAGDIPQPTIGQTPRVPRFVGVFVNAPAADVRRMLDLTGLDYAQLHGDEPVDDLLDIGGRGYKALRPTTAQRALTDAALFGPLVRHRGPRLLIDTYDPSAYGGTGSRGDWELAAKLAKQTSHLLLAGGLTPENVADAVRAVRPWGVDVASGVESSPGRKDQTRVADFIRKAKAA
jgi:phosphoribosylanthranilate isomerase